MKDLKKLAQQCIQELGAVGICCGNVKQLAVNYRAKKRWGVCKKQSDGSFIIEIAEVLLQDHVSDIAVKNTLIHELLHTCPGCFSHTGKWKQYADHVNRMLPQYTIKRVTAAEEKGVTLRKKEPVYRYILVCSSCNQYYKRQRISPVIEHPERYRCSCGGKLQRIK